MWKGYDVKRGDFSEAFKKYLRTRGLYFEPSADGSWVHFEIKDPDKDVDQFLEDYENRVKYVYEFPTGTTSKDIDLAKRLGLKYLGKAKYNRGAEAFFIEGTIAELKNFIYEAFGDYEMHPDYLCKADEFAGVEELKEAGYFEDGKYCGDKKMNLRGSKFKDSNDSKVIEMAQQEMDRLVEEELADLYFDDEGNEIDDWYKGDGANIQAEINSKVIALCELINAYGGTPILNDGWLGIYEGYNGPSKLKYSKK